MIEDKVDYYVGQCDSCISHDRHRWRVPEDGPHLCVEVLGCSCRWRWCWWWSKWWSPSSPARLRCGGSFLQSSLQEWSGCGRAMDKRRTFSELHETPLSNSRRHRSYTSVHPGVTGQTSCWVKYSQSQASMQVSFLTFAPNTKSSWSSVEWKWASRSEWRIHSRLSGTNKMHESAKEHTDVLNVFQTAEL